MKILLTFTFFICSSFALTVIAFKLPAVPEATPIPTPPEKNVDIADELATPVENK